MTTPVLSKTLAAGDIAVADDLMTLFEDLVAAVENVDTSRIAADAGITSKQLSDRCALWSKSIVLVPYSAGANLMAPTDFTLTGSVVLYKEKFCARVGREVSLLELLVHVTEVTVAAPYPTIGLYINGVLIGGGVITLDTATFYRIGYADPVASPLLTLADGDLIEFRLDVSEAGTASIRNLIAVLAFKTEVIS